MSINGHPLRIAMIGQKGLPATFGGVERHVEEVGSRLTEFGHSVTVYCRTTYTQERLETYRGMRLCYLPAVGTKHLDALSHSAASTVAAIMSGHDIVHYHALGPGLFAPLPRYTRTAKVVLTVHGLDHERAKWRLPARCVLGTAHWMSGHVPDATVAVSRFLVNHYAHCHHRYAVYIPNGVDEPVTHGAAHIEQELGLAPGSYVLFVGRLVPEKAPDQLIRAFRGIPGDCKLVLAGGSSFTDGYVARLRALAAQDRRILFTGYTYGELLAELYSNAAAFVLPSLLEGLPLTLLEAASYGVPVVASDIPPHIEVLGCDGCGHHLFPVGDESALFRVLCHVLEMRRYEQVSAQRLRQHVLGTYRWDRVAAEVEHLYQELVVRSRR